MRGSRWLIVLALALALAMAGCAEQTDDTDGSRDVDDGAEPGSDPGGDASDPSNDDGGAEPGDGQAREPPDVVLESVVSGLELPTLVTSPEDGTGRLFVLEQPGRVRIVEDGELREEPYLDLTDRTQAQGEQGLLGMAFDPAFTDNGRLYVSYTDNEGDSVLETYTVDEPETGRPSGDGTELLTVEQPYGNHNGGHITFGPDGYLYYGLGDGGSGGDPEGNGQDPSTLLGSMLRLDVSGEQARPAPGNPFADDDEGHDMIWAYGLRNPWRFSFDAASGDLYIGDVGQNSWEEVNHQPAASQGGENYGWNRWEGTHAFEGEPAREGYTFPILEYPLEDGKCAVTGGHVYRGEAIDGLEGFYLYADHCTGTIWAAQNTSDGWRSQTLLTTDHRIPSFGVDADGEPYIVTRDGGLYQIVEA